MNYLSSEVRFWETWFHESLSVLTHALTVPYTCVWTGREWGIKRDMYISKGMRKSLRNQGLPSNLLLLTDFSQQLKQLVGTSVSGSFPSIRGIKTGSSSSYAC